MSDSPAVNFKQAYCQRYKCADERFQRHLLRRCLHRRATILFFLYRRNERALQAGLHLMETIGNARTSGDVANALDTYYGWVRLERSWLMSQGKFRVSGTRLFKILEALFPGSTERGLENSRFSQQTASQEAPRGRRPKTSLPSPPAPAPQGNAIHSSR